MAMLGKGVLAIWNGIEAGAAEDFETWHIREHIPERVGVPGFLRGRRYVAVDGFPAYFNFYEAESVDTFVSAPYRARLDDPTPWTRRVVARFTDTSRTACTVAVSLGQGEGAWIDTLRLQTALPTEQFAPLLSAALAEPGIVGVHLLEGQADKSKVDTAEKKIRGVPDQVAAWVLLVEAIEPEYLTRLRAGVLSDQALGGEAQRGLYRLQYGLTK